MYYYVTGSWQTGTLQCPGSLNKTCGILHCTFLSFLTIPPRTWRSMKSSVKFLFSFEWTLDPGSWLNLKILFTFYPLGYVQTYCDIKTDLGPRSQWKTSERPFGKTRHRDQPLSLSSELWHLEWKINVPIRTKKGPWPLWFGNLL